MLYTECGTECDWDWVPLALANGVEWANDRKGCKDRFDCLYRRGIHLKALWYIGALMSLFIEPEWIARGKKKRQYESERLKKLAERENELMQEYFNLPDDEFERVNQHLAQ